MLIQKLGSSYLVQTSEGEKSIDFAQENPLHPNKNGDMDHGFIIHDLLEAVISKLIYDVPVRKNQNTVEAILRLQETVSLLKASPGGPNYSPSEEVLSPVTEINPTPPEEATGPNVKFNKIIHRGETKEAVFVKKEQRGMNTFLLANGEEVLVHDNNVIN